MEEPIKKVLFPKGNANFRYIRENDYVYVDKTRYIELLEYNNDKSVHMLRPRRFGKSLFTSALSCYYDIAEKDNFDLIFKNTYIYEHPTKNRNSYYVLNLNFSELPDIQSKNFENIFTSIVIQSLNIFLDRYKIRINLVQSDSAASILASFFVDVNPLLNNKKIYVIIDEYDHFANELLSFNFQEFTSVTNSDGFVRAFYEEIKYATENIVSKVFITGVSPITLDSLTSGFNISINLSLDPRFNEMFGFTTDEMTSLISMVPSIQDKQTVLKEMKQYYDGYMFSREGKHHMFNPNMAIYYLDYWQTFGKQPLEIVDKNILSDYQKLENLIYLPYDHDTSIQIRNILDGNYPLINLTEMFMMHTGLTTDDFYSLLYYLGYLTIDKADEFGMTLRIPNMIMQKVFIKYFRHMLEKQLQIQADISSWQKSIINFLRNDDPSKFIKEIEKVLHKYPDRMFQNFHERNIQQIADMIVEAVSGVDVDLEWVNDNGYGDFMMIPANEVYPNKLIEFKYLKVEYTKYQLDKVIEEGKHEIQKYKATRQMNRQRCDAYIMVFSKCQCIYLEYI